MKPLFSSSLVLFLSLLATSQSVYAQTNPCADIKTIRTVKVPWDPSKPKSPKFDFRFKYDLVNPLSPTVVVLAGDLGESSIYTSNNSWPLSVIPANYNKIYFDPRSLGCNYAVESAVLVPFLKTDFVVNDILVAIKSLNLRNYMIYGSSYGTVLATQLVKKIETEKLELPTALVLESTIGKKFDTFDSYFYFHQYEWEKILNQLDPKWKNFFLSGKFEAPFTKSQWASLIVNDLGVGDIPDRPANGHILFWHLNLLERYFAKKIVTPLDRSQVALVLAKLQEPPFPNLFFRVIGCGELWGDWYYGRSLESGRLVRTGKNVCDGLDYKNAYDASKYQIPTSVPIYYFQGANDPVTPMYTALYHLAVQKKTQRQFITVTSASHAPLTRSLRACADELWTGMFSQRTLSREFTSCSRKSISINKQPGQE